VTLQRTRGILFGTFIFGLAIQVAVAIAAYANRAIVGSDESALTLKLLSIYSVPLAVILGGLFAKPSSGKKTSSTGSQPVASLAVALALLWNLILLSRSLMFAYAVVNPRVDDNVDQLISFLDTVSTTSSFLIAGALAFFFTK
jgi:hypothetical protein